VVLKLAGPYRTRFSPPVNAFNENFWRELGSVFGSIAKDGNVRVVVLASALPKLFTAGLDRAYLPHSETRGLTERPRITVTESGVLTRTNEIQDASRRAILLRDHILNFQGAISVIEKCPQPVIGAVHGVSFGLAIDILCACDIRYAASDTRFSIKVVMTSHSLIKVLIIKFLSITGG
jgi:enoyl-CoA hydratase/carnithine racemase